MGVKGLTTLVDRHSRELLEDIYVRDTKIVIDGLGLLWFFLESMIGVDPMPHGGEYAKLQTRVRKFFHSLQRCRCQPFVVFDGGSDLDGKKMKTHLRRFGERIKTANAVTAKGKRIHCGYLLGRLLMIQVLKEMKVNFVCCQFEADREIALLANQWGCPVLGKDSDYFIMDIVGGYIPFNTLKWHKPRKSQNGTYYLPGKLYKLNTFCNVFGIKRKLLPLFGTLCFNDYFCPRQVSTFLSKHVYKSYKDSKGNHRQAELEDLLRWLSQWKTLQEGLGEIFKHLSDTLEGPLMTSIGVYDISKETSILLSFFEESENLYRDLTRSPFCRDLGIPLWVAEAHQRGDIMNVCVDIMGQGSCVTLAQVENPRSPSAWLPSMPLFAIYAGMFLVKKSNEAEPGKNVNCTVHVREGNKVGQIKVTPTVSIDTYGQLPALSEIPSLTESLKQRLNLSIFAPNLTTNMELVYFPSEFQLALLATAHWINVTETRISKHQLTALLLGWVYLYTEKHEKGRGQHGRQFAKVRRIESEANLTLRRKKPDPTVSQGFVEWQYSFLYAVYINKLIQYPLPECSDVALLFGGLLMHGLVNKLRGEFPRCTFDHVHREAEQFLPDCSANVKNLFKSMYSFVMSNVKREVRAKLDMFEVGIVTPTMTTKERTAKKTILKDRQIR